MLVLRARKSELAADVSTLGLLLPGLFDTNGLVLSGAAAGVTIGRLRARAAAGEGGCVWARLALAGGTGE